MQTVEVEKKETDDLLEEFRSFARLDRSWMVNAACRGLHPDLFHPTMNDAGTQKAAMLVCNGDQRPVRNRKTRKLELVGTPPCPVRDKCLDYVMSLTQTQDVAGVFAGLSHSARKLLRRKREKASS